jgi:hypothetical protein
MMAQTFSCGIVAVVDRVVVVVVVEVLVVLEQMLYEFSLLAVVL